MKHFFYRQLSLVLVLAMLIPLTGMAEGGTEGVMVDEYAVGDILAPEVEENPIELPDVDIAPSEEQGGTAVPEWETVEDPANPVNAAQATIPKTLTLGKGETYKFNVKNASYKSSKKSVATVDKKGKIKAKKKGTAKITVTVKGQKAQTCKVTVLDAPKSIALSGKSRKLSLGSVIMLTATLPKKTASQIKWTSSKKSVATVDANGVVRALKKGKAKITAKTFNGKKAVCTITVDDAPSSVSFDMDALSIGVKEKVKLKPVVNDGAKAKFTWTSKDGKIAAVDKNGKVTGKKTGSTEITVNTQNGLSATLKVTVHAAPKKVTLNKKSAELAAGATLQLKATMPKKTTSQIKWSTSDKTVATVDKNGLVTAVAKGEAKITAETFNGKKNSCVVKVRETTVEDQFQALIEIIDTSDGDGVDISKLKAGCLSIADFDNAENMSAFIERYNGLTNELNAEIDSYLVYLDGLVDAMGQMDDALGETKITVTDDGIEIENDVVSFSIISSVSSAAANGLKHSIEVNIGGEKAVLVPNVKAVDAVAEAMSLTAWLDLIAGWIDIFNDSFNPCLDKAQSIVDIEQERVDDLIEQEQLLEKAEQDAKRDLRKAKGNKQKAIRQRALDKARENLKKVRSELSGVKKSLGDALTHLDKVKKLWTWFKRLVNAHMDAVAAAIYDQKIAHEIDKITIHAHPANNRECFDKIRRAYCDKLNEDIYEVQNALIEDLSFNGGVVAFDLLVFTPEGWGGQLCKDICGKALESKLISLLSKIKISKFAQNKWVQRLAKATGLTVKTGVEVKTANEIRTRIDVPYNRVRHYDDILHGKIKGTIIGKVIDAETKQPIEGVKMQISGENGVSGYNNQKPANAATNKNGAFLVEALYGDYSGEFALWFYKENYKLAFGEVVVDEDKNDPVIAVTMEKMYGAVHGKVYDNDTKKPLGGVAVTCQGCDMVITDSKGEYTIKNVLRGENKFSFIRNGYDPVEETVTVKEDTPLNVYMKQSVGTVSGTVIDADTGRALSGVSVQCLGIGKVMTNSSGQYTIGKVPLGENVIRFGKGGYEPVKKTVTVTADNTKPVDATLKKVKAIRFGYYEQDNNLSNGKEPIEWTVLEVREDGTVLAISKYILDYFTWSSRWGTKGDMTFDEEDLSWYSYSTMLMPLDEAVNFGLGGGTPTAYARAKKRYSEKDHSGNDYACWWGGVPVKGEFWHSDWQGFWITKTGEKMIMQPTYTPKLDLGFRPAILLSLDLL